ncbi:hypothetical protein BJV78DRAFT_1360340 [Lactifluus subvellereus]|nr:hypothetical protein BJV78DRAFT_1360340 [Lactifluus subvellereus]
MTRLKSMPIMTHDQRFILLLPLSITAGFYISFSRNKVSANEVGIFSATKRRSTSQVFAEAMHMCLGCFHPSPGHRKATDFLFLQVLHIVNQDVVAVAVSIGAGAERKGRDVAKVEKHKYTVVDQISPQRAALRGSFATGASPTSMTWSHTPHSLNPDSEAPPKSGHEDDLTPRSGQLLSPNSSFEVYEHEHSVALLSAPVSPCPRIPISGHSY